MENRPGIYEQTYACIKNIASSNFSFLHELEDLSELRELPNLEGGVDEATGEEVDGFLSVEAVANVGSLDGNHSDDRREYFG